MSKTREHDVLVVGGGITGAALALGLQARGAKVTVLDAPTYADTATRSNVGLIWCQSKFAHLPQYAKWGFMSSRLYPELVSELEEESGLTVPVRYTGGLIPCLGDEEMQKRADYIETLRGVLGEYKGSVIDRAELEKKLPRIAFGKEVKGAAWCEEDGVVDPLALLRAYKATVTNRGVVWRVGLAHKVTPHDGGYKVSTNSGDLYCGTLVLAAGLANRRLSRFALPDLPVFADKGQVLLVERLPEVMPIPVLGVTQTFGGTIIIGFRHEKAGYDIDVVPASAATEGAWALRVWPGLAQKRLIRSWGGLRVMPNDAMAIYSRLPNHPNAVLVNTHSAITMAAVHSRLLPEYILGGDLPEVAQGMTLQRFGFSC